MKCFVRETGELCLQAAWQCSLKTLVVTMRLGESYRRPKVDSFDGRQPRQSDKYGVFSIACIDRSGAPVLHTVSTSNHFTRRRTSCPAQTSRLSAHVKCHTFIKFKRLRFYTPTTRYPDVLPPTPSLPFLNAMPILKNQRKPTPNPPQNPKPHMNETQPTPSPSPSAQCNKSTTPTSPHPSP